ncbi:DUF4233 domain-containing protein [Actinokineospora globicatena]|uniref:DUF4233 domain-containing protein n=1 Tax=Actinokineospora globicatena TaxID=103729 RepID=A0A9W6VC84_9PSEU|nr:DUF4233 domain-containing protein [Actinokineospora globicatena]MCP2305238.1 Protein of unknown function (DUF4233) [Actinokineospora globicatena]GLW80713.1 hypothetical protein Aglo01_51940 [Actinokineospora globicatena]GLW87540.1 hypothetical protein Aglo02_51790 [Actinokineospora globicatena]GLW93738.1 hypothetical protein Aglo03_45540 [Actinokineospora globicatena]
MTAPDPMKGFRGVMSAVLILEALVVLLALLVVAKSDGGLATWQGWSVGTMALILILTCAFVGRPWGIHLAAALQIIMLGGFFIDSALGIVAVVFALGWTWMLWARHDVLKRMSEGRLASQQPPPD